MTSPHRESNDDNIPLAYFITFRAYGTWLHGDERGSVDRLHNTFGSPRLPPNPLRRNYERRMLKRPPTHLSKNRRAAIERGIRETCKLRNWSLLAFNIRTNHVHTVVSANCKSEKVLAALKANATRTLREARLWQSGHSRGRTKVAEGIFGQKGSYPQPYIMFYMIKVSPYLEL